MYETVVQCEAYLKNANLWKLFDRAQTEMIITKAGRRMFPSFQVDVRKLQPTVMYCLFLEMSLMMTDDVVVDGATTSHRYKYTPSAGGWLANAHEPEQSQQRIVMHPDSPASGAYWMSQTVNFNRVKLTNATHHIVHQNDAQQKIVLTSMHRYQPRLIVAQTDSAVNLRYCQSVSVEFVETSFIAVTAYQNDRITRLKIDHNPFAKGFRDNGLASAKRKRTKCQNDSSSSSDGSYSNDSSVTSAMTVPLSGRKKSTFSDFSINRILGL